MNTIVDVESGEMFAGVPLSERGPASARVVAAFGFWLFLLSDIIVFSALFAAYGVLSGQTNGGPSAIELFDKRHVLYETSCLLASSFACGMMMIATDQRDVPLTYFSALVTAAFGIAFLWLEFSEFAHMVEKGAGPSRSGFLSAFFTLVGTHGVHVASGLIALIYLTAQVIAKGLQATTLRRLCWSLFWHALDIVWVGVFTLVYLMGD